ncbi:MAG: 30S ribosomal protein S7 [Desulfobacterales bacterium C00003060]|nr:MAG: 30S ribosomal protein S7 [Desulfobacterales bacterium S3730MH5]OEU76996.1 MAG: 30S ribosomal protein S7 [Desulfobacterales bacterium C00003060]OEU78480.1 MAG: 30S ribosomal protein S7 [Desulfobacterales bacterium S5133MH4]
MSRKREIAKRVTMPDPKYKSKLVSRFVNCLMKDGKKSVAESILYDAFAIVEKRSKEPPLKIFEKAMENAKPRIEVKSRRVGGSTYQVPIEVRGARQTALGIRWLISFAGKRSEKSMAEKLAGELIDAGNQRGATIKKRDDTHKMAEANKAFAHYRW